jgi:hypothetical protein
MATRKKVSKDKLCKLGAEALSELLIEESDRNAALKQRLVLLLASQEGPNAVAKEVRKRIATFARSTSFVDWKAVRKFEQDLRLPLAAIVRQIAPADREQALELMWRFLDLSESCMERCDDSSGVIGGLFRDAVDWLGDIASNHPSLPDTFVDDVFERLQRNGYGIYDNLLTAVHPALSAANIDDLRQRLKNWHEAALGGSNSRKMGAIAAKLGLQALADAEGDVDSYIETHDANSLSNPAIVACVATRLVAAGRAKEALSYLDDAIPEGEFGFIEWNDARIAALAASGDEAGAQNRRWQMFQRTLDDRYLREYLRELPDFEDVDAEQKALAWAETAEDVHRALALLTYWPAHDRASRLVLSRISEMDGNAYYILSPVAESLQAKYPLAAVLLRRSLIEATLNGAKSTRYKHAVRHMLEIDGLDRQITNYGEHESHEEFLSRIRQKHSRKRGFWSMVESAF